MAVGAGFRVGGGRGRGRSRATLAVAVVAVVVAGTGLVDRLAVAGQVLSGLVLGQGQGLDELVGGGRVGDHGVAFQRPLGLPGAQHVPERLGRGRARVGYRKAVGQRDEAALEPRELEQLDHQPRGVGQVVEVAQLFPDPFDSGRGRAEPLPVQAGSSGIHVDPELAQHAHRFVGEPEPAHRRAGPRIAVADLQRQLELPADVLARLQDRVFPGAEGGEEPLVGACGRHLGFDRGHRLGQPLGRGEGMLLLVGERRVRPERVAQCRVELPPLAYQVVDEIGSLPPIDSVDSGVHQFPVRRQEPPPRRTPLIAHGVALGELDDHNQERPLGDVCVGLQRLLPCEHRDEQVRPGGLEPLDLRPGLVGEEVAQCHAEPAQRRMVRVFPRNLPAGVGQGQPQVVVIHREAVEGQAHLAGGGEERRPADQRLRDVSQLGPLGLHRGGPDGPQQLPGAQCGFGPGPAGRVEWRQQRHGAERGGGGQGDGHDHGGGYRGEQ
ncbi:hypothetical protein GCM10023321_73370 [Pseudonocardia eucalypti]|uniref:Uncharacterized protein n=1 Tax=Pseudonocardia eucalypti TaxID=648755 RepID=A0ABP9R8V3_9PSEU